MYSRYLLCYTGCLGLCLSSVVRAFPSVLLNASVVPTESGNRTLGAWPARLPWTMDIPGSDELSITVHHYGRFAPQFYWNFIREALKDCERRFDNDDEDWRIPTELGQDSILSSGIVSIDIHIMKTPHSLPSTKEYARILKTIDDLFFVFKDKPREITLSIERNRVVVASLELKWRDAANPWPQHLPWKIETHDSELTIMVILYGRDFDQSALFERRFRDAFWGVTDNLPDVMPRSGGSCSFDILRVDIEPLPNTDLIIPKDRLRYILMHIAGYTIMFKELEPREFGVHVELAGYPGAKIFFTVIDPGEGIDQE